jgi:hypothetical protein
MNSKSSPALTALVSVACLMSTAVAAPAAGEEVATPTIIPAETLKWNPTPFPDVTAAVIAGNPTAGGMYAIFAKYRAGGTSAPTRTQISALSRLFRELITWERAVNLTRQS